MNYQYRSPHAGHPPQRQHPYPTQPYTQPPQFEDIGSELARVEPYYPAPVHYYEPPYPAHYPHPRQGNQLVRVEPTYPAYYPRPYPPEFYPQEDLADQLAQVVYEPTPGNTVVAKIAIEADRAGMLHLKMVGREEVINLGIEAFQAGAEQMQRRGKFGLHRKPDPIEVTIEADPPQRPAHSEEYQRVMAKIAAEREALAIAPQQVIPNNVGATGNALFDYTFIALSRWCGFKHPVLTPLMALIMMLVFALCLYRGAQMVLSTSPGAPNVATLSEPNLDRPSTGRSPPLV